MRFPPHTNNIMKKNHNLHIFIMVMVIALCQHCALHKPQFQGSSFDTHRSLEGTGFSQNLLDSLRNYIQNNLSTTGMMILQDGKVVFEYGDLEEVSYLASCRKSILTMLYGKYVENGTIDLNQTIGEIGIDDVDGLLDIEKTATVDHILTARSGVFHQPANGGYDEANVLTRGSVKPGEYFLYNNWDYNVAGTIFEIKSGKDIYQEMEEQLAIPLGFQDWSLKNQKKRSNNKKSIHPAYHMYLSTRDMAKIGQLMLNKGQWQGKQLISKAWIEKITTTITPSATVNQRYHRDKNSPYQFVVWLLLVVIS